MIVHFNVTSFTAGYRATWDDPGAGDEFGFEFVSAEFDRGGCDDAPGPITEAETAQLKAWLFADGYDKARDAAESYAADRAAVYADFIYDQWRDERRQ